MKSKIYNFSLLVVLLVAGSSFCWGVPGPIKEVWDRGLEKNMQIMTKNYIFELCSISVLCLFIVNYFYGTKANRRIADLWVQHNKELFESQFSVVGINEEGAAKPFRALDQERANLFKFFCTGRVNVRYCMVTIETQKRQDLISMLLLDLIWPEKDRVSIDIPIDCEGKDAPPICFGLMRRKLTKKAMEDYDDLKIMAKKWKVDGVSSKLAVFSDHDEFFKTFFDKQTKDLLRKYEKNIEFIHITDRQTFLRTPLGLRATFILPKASRMEDTKELSLFVLKLIEKVVNYKVSTKLAKQLSTYRDIYNAKREETEEKKKENEERLKKEKEDKWAKMTPKERKKAMELESKRARKRGMRKMKIK